MWIWYFDRQGIIFSRNEFYSRPSPFHCPPTYLLSRALIWRTWGVISIFNPNAKRAHQTAMDVTDAPADHLRCSARLKHDPKRQAANVREQRKRKAGKIDINLSELQQLKRFLPNLESVTLDLKMFLTPEPHCIARKATAVIEATGKTSTGELLMVWKLYHPAIQRQHEGAVMETVRLIAQSEAPEMLKNLPTLYFYRDLLRFSTNRIRNIIGVSWKGHRTTRLIGLKTLQEITTLTSGPKFTKAWLDVVTCE